MLGNKNDVSEETFIVRHPALDESFQCAEKTSKPVPSFTKKNFNEEKSGNIPLPRPDFSVTLHI